MKFNEKQAYTLGFMFADGHINKVNCISIDCVSVDIENISSTLYSLLDWNVHKSHRDRNGVMCQPQTMLYKGNKELALYLKKHGYGPNRNGNLALSIIPKKAKHMWFRGYLDGDGCLYYNKKNYLRQLAFSGPHTLDWSFIMNNFDGFYKHSNSLSCRTSKLDNIVSFMNYIYPKGYDGVGLYRKYNKYELML